MFVRMVIVVVVCLSAMLSCTKVDNVSPLAQLVDSAAPDQVSYDVDVAFIENSITKAVLKSYRARIFSRQKYTMMDSGVAVTFYDETGIAGTMTSDSLRVDDKTQNMFAYGNVVVVANAKHIRMTTEHLFWDNKLRKIHTDAFVRIISPTDTIKGYGMESDDKFQNYRIFRVTGSKQM